MSLKSQFVSCTLAGLLVVGSVPFVEAQSRTSKTSTASASNAQRTLTRAAKKGEYTFLLFYKQNDAASRRMAAVLKETLTDKTKRGAVVYVRVGDSAEQALVAKYGVSRAPMPITLAIAPNGAITGVFAQKLTADKINDAFVTPTMMITMKSLQSGKLVLVNAQGSTQAPLPVALKAFQSDPHFKDRLVTISMRVADPREAKFVGQMRLDPKARTTQIVLIAPPGVLVGKFGATASKAEIAAALAKAGKCCDDPKCRHNK